MGLVLHALEPASAMKEFSILGFVEHLAVITAEIDHEEKRGLTEACEVIQKEAQDSLGHYQAATGPFVEWAPLAEATKEDRLRQGFPEDEPELRTGALGQSIEYTVLPGTGLGNREAEVGSNEPVMEYQELGTVNMPPRSILGGAAARKSDEVAAILGEHYVSALLVGQGSAIIGSFIPIRRR